MNTVRARDVESITEVTEVVKTFVRLTRSVALACVSIIGGHCRPMTSFIGRESQQTLNSNLGRNHFSRYERSRTATISYSTLAAEAYPHPRAPVERTCPPIAGALR